MTALSSLSPIRRVAHVYSTRFLHAALILTIIIMPAANADTASAYVVFTRGPWKLLPGGPLLRVGLELRSGDRITLGRTPTPSDELIVADNLGRLIVRLHCATANCRNVVTIHGKAHDDETFVSRLFTAIVKRLDRDGEEQYTSLITRASGTALYEGVVQIGARVDLRPIAGDLSAGQWNLSWRPIGPAVPDTEIRVPLDVPGDEVVSLADLSPGLYQVRAFRRGMEGKETAQSEAWVLAAQPCTYSAARKSFAAAMTITEMWTDDVGADVVRTFLRAALADAAADAAKPREK